MSGCLLWLPPVIQGRRIFGCRGRVTWSASRSTASPCRSAWSWTVRAGATSPPGRAQVSGQHPASDDRDHECDSGGAKKQYRFWSALLGVRDPEPKLRTSSATPAQLEQLGLKSGMNSLEYRVETSTGTVVTSQANIFLLNNTAKIVVSDIDGTVTKYEKHALLTFIVRQKLKLSSSDLMSEDTSFRLLGWTIGNTQELWNSIKRYR